MKIELKNITKSFHKQKILQNINLTINPGEVYGFLGPNGAGKTTTIKIMLGLIFPDSGEVLLDDSLLDTKKAAVFKAFGTLVEEPSLLPELSGMDNLKYFSLLRNLKPNTARLFEKADFFGLDKKSLKKKVVKYSMGMKQRLAICISLLHDPGVLVYDEPTNGLDPQGITFIRDFLREKAHREGKTVFISSHNLAEVEKICDRVTIINHGKIAASGTVDEVIRENNFRDLEEAFLQLTGEKTESGQPD
jgi:ABC-type multidrug transport system ATPase subunit